VPGSTCACRSASSTVSLSTGSTTISSLSSSLALSAIPPVHHGVRHRGIRAPDHVGLGVGDVLVGRRRRVAPERLVVGGDGRGHTEGGVGVVVPGAEAAPRELPQRVRRLVRLLAASQHRDAVPRFVSARPRYARRPSRSPSPSVGTRVPSSPDEGPRQPVPVGVRGLADPALAGEAAVDRMGRVASDGVESVVVGVPLLEVTAPDGTPHTRRRPLAHRRTGSSVVVPRRAGAIDPPAVPIRDRSEIGGPHT